MSDAAVLPDPDEPDERPVLDPSSTTAAGQGSDIPLGWKPSVAEPVPVVRCVTIKSDGERCKNWSIRGYTKCRRHAGPGALMKDGNVQKYAESVIEAARLRLVDSTDMALDTLEQLLQPGTGEAIRLKASTEVLDRVGIRGGFDVNVEVEVTESPADEIRKRLSDLAKGAEASRELAAKAQASDPDIVDAEIVSHDDDQPSLFDMPESSDDDDA